MLTTLRNSSKNTILKFVLGTLLTILILSFAMWGTEDLVGVSKRQNTVASEGIGLDDTPWRTKATGEFVLHLCHMPAQSRGSGFKWLVRCYFQYRCGPVHGQTYQALPSKVEVPILWT